MYRLKIAGTNQISFGPVPILMVVKIIWSTDYISYHFRMVICGLTSPKLDFADAAGMLDIGGFDPTVPTLIHRFIQGEL